MIDVDLMLVVPTRRPHNAERMMEAIDATSRGLTSVLLGTDDDDGRFYPGRYRVIRPRMGVVSWINELSEAALRDYDPLYIGHIGDDCVPRTIGWDVRLIEALQRQPFAFANDLYPLRPPGQLACHIFTRAEIVASLGYLGPPAFQSMYVDDVWTAWGRACGIEFLEDVIIEHMHPTAGKAPADELYARSAAYMGSGHAAFREYMGQNFHVDVAKIRAAMP